MRSHGIKLGWLGVAVTSGQAQRSNGPLTIASQGSFFVGGEKKELPRPPAGTPGAAFGGGKVNAAGGDATMMPLPKLGIRGNSHMLMQDKNSLRVAALVIEWIDEHVEN